MKDAISSCAEFPFQWDFRVEIPFACSETHLAQLTVCCLRQCIWVCGRPAPPTPTIRKSCPLPQVPSTYLWSVNSATSKLGTGHLSWFTPLFLALFLLLLFLPLFLSSPFHCHSFCVNDSLGYFTHLLMGPHAFLLLISEGTVSVTKTGLLSCVCSFSPVSFFALSHFFAIWKFINFASFDLSFFSFVESRFYVTHRKAFCSARFLLEFFPPTFIVNVCIFDPPGTYFYVRNKVQSPAPPPMVIQPTPHLFLNNPSPPSSWTLPFSHILFSMCLRLFLDFVVFFSLQLHAVTMYFNIVGRLFSLICPLEYFLLFLFYLSTVALSFVRFLGKSFQDVFLGSWVHIWTGGNCFI